MGKNNILNYLFSPSFSIIISSDKSREYDVEGAQSKDAPGPVIDKTFVSRTDSRWLATDGGALPDLPVNATPRRQSLKENHLVFIVEKQQQQVNLRPGGIAEKEVTLSLTKKTSHLIKSLIKKVFKS